MGKVCYLTVNKKRNIVVKASYEKDEETEDGFEVKRAFILSSKPILYETEAGKWVLEDVGESDG